MEFIDLKTQAAQIKKNVMVKISESIDNAAFILGSNVIELEEILVDYSGTKFAVTCSSGTDALLLCLMAYGVKPGDVILTTPFTFFATAEVISLLGAEPYFVDIDENTFNIDPEKLEQLLNDYNSESIKKLQGKKIRGIIPVDLFGLPADYNRINEIAKKNDLFVIEDAAQSFGAGYMGKKAGSLSPISATSFFPAKPLGCYGDGGAVFTSDENVKELLLSLRVHGQGVDKYENVRIGINGRLDAIQAIVLIEKLKLFSGELDQRNIVAKRYSDKLKDYVKVPFIPEGYTSAWAQYSICSENRDKIMKALSDKKIPSVIYYVNPLHLQKAFKYLNFKEGDYPISEKVSKQIFSLPMHPYLGKDDQEKVINCIIDSLN